MKFLSARARGFIVGTATALPNIAQTRCHGGSDLRTTGDASQRSNLNQTWENEVTSGFLFETFTASSASLAGRGRKPNKLGSAPNAFVRATPQPSRLREKREAAKASLEPAPNFVIEKIELVLRSEVSQEAAQEERSGGLVP